MHGQFFVLFNNDKTISATRLNLEGMELLSQGPV